MIDLSPHFPPVDNQHVGTKTCVSKVMVAMRSYYNRVQCGDETALSSQFVHYNARVNSPSFRLFTGATLDAGLTAVQKFGIAPAADCAYCIETPNEKPSNQAYINAQQYKTAGFTCLLTVDDVLNNLHDGHPVGFVMRIYDTFSSDTTANTGEIITPAAHKTVKFNHAVIAVGFSNNHIKVRNSQGDQWGDKGYFYMPINLLFKKRFAIDFRKMNI